MQGAINDIQTAQSAMKGQTKFTQDKLTEHVHLANEQGVYGIRIIHIPSHFPRGTLGGPFY